MSSVNCKSTAKVKSQNHETRTVYKPILPKLTNAGVMSRVIEIHAPTLPMCKCFVCDGRVINMGVPLLQSTTQVSNTDLPTKIGQLMGEKFMVVVSADDVLCRKCHALVNHVDRLESDLLIVKRTLKNHLKKKYGLNEDQLIETDNKLEHEIEIKHNPDTEYVIVQEEAEEDSEPLFKKPRANNSLRYRAIKPKPPGSFQLLKCSSCNFITTQHDLLSCHKVVCNALAYKCTMCDKKFDSQKMVRNHKIEAHLTKWTCHFCNISFTEENSFTLHMKSHLGDRITDKSTKTATKAKPDEVNQENLDCVFKCQQCSESFEALSQLQIHLVNHTNSVTFKCVRCDIGFENKQELIDHVQTHEDVTVGVSENASASENIGETIYSCPTCSLNFLQEDLYIRHLSMHPELIATEQNENNLNLFIEANHENHESQENGQEKSFECPNCGEKKEDQDILDMHRLTECLGIEKKPDAAEEEIKNNDFQQNSGEEASHLELNQLFYVNSLNVQLIDGNVVLQNASEEKIEKTSDDNPETNSKSVEDILTNMFQVEGDKNEEDHDQKVPENESQLSNLKQSKNKTYVCADCSFSTQNLVTLRKHFMEKHESVKCWVCSKTFPMEELKKHMETAHGETQPAKAYPCVHCNEQFTNRRALHHHEVSHPENLIIDCPDCGEKFARDKFLNEHRDMVHAISHCRVCSKAFDNVKQLKSHEARHARSDKTHFKCTECDRIFQTPTGLRHHKAIHTGEFKYKCEFCNKGFVSRVRYEEHRASHTKEERYSCEICGKKFSFQATYWIHRKWHDNPTPYKCEYCGRLFKHSSLLSVHKRKHTGERPYECPHCDQSFTVGNTLKRHLMLHTGVFPFSCQVCHQGFSAKHKLALHMSKVHQDESFLEKQLNKKPAEYKMVVKHDEKPDEKKDDEVLENQTWILTQDDHHASQLLTIQIEEGDTPGTLLTDEMIGQMVNTNNRIVEIIPYDSVKGENDETNFIQINQSHRSSLGIESDDEEFTNHSEAYSTNDSKIKSEDSEDLLVNSSTDRLNNETSAETGEIIEENFVTGL